MMIAFGMRGKLGFDRLILFEKLAIPGTALRDILSACLTTSPGWGSGRQMIDYPNSTLELFYGG